MVGPKLIKTEDKRLSVSDNTKKLFRAIYQDQNKTENKPDNEISKIRVSALISKVAFVYEKIRNAVDYDEENLLRKNAIERILKRQIVIEGVLKVTASEEISLNLITELIRAGYLPNNEIPETKIQEVAVLLEKYIKLKNYSLEKISTFSDINKDVKLVKNKLNERNQLIRWLISLAATEIEENLSADQVKQTVIQNIYDDLEKNIVADIDLSEELKKDLKIQIYLSIHRKYLKYNNPMLSLILFRYYNRSWNQENMKEEDIMEIAHNIIPLRQAINKQLEHPLRKQIDKITKKYAIFFTIMTEIISNNPVKTYGEVKSNLRGYIQQVQTTYTRKYKSLKSKLWRSGWRSILYIFLTKSVFAVLIEVPAVHWFNEDLNYFALFVNISFPALLLFLIILLTRKPTSKNLGKVVEGIKEITYEEEGKSTHHIIKKPAQRSLAATRAFQLIYTAAFLFSIYVVIQVLSAISFNWVSIVIFLFFLAFVSFFSIRIKRNLKEFIIEERKDNLADFLFDFFFMPIVAAGRWLSEKASKVNVFVFILDFIIEAPFKVFVEIAEDWTKYVKERKEEIM